MIRGKPRFKTAGRCVDGSVKRTLALDIAFLTAKVAHRVLQVACQNAPQPSDALRFGVASELLPPLVSLEHGLLHDVRCVQFRLQPGV
jgi:hypothetical protein